MIFKLINKIFGLEIIVYSSGKNLPLFLEKVRKSLLDYTLKYFGRVSIEKIIETVPECDIGIIPNRLFFLNRSTFQQEILSVYT